MVTALVLLLLTWLLLPLPAHSATYYLAPGGNDGNPCTQQAPCQTVRRGAPLLKPGDTLYLRGGTYTENINNALTIPSGTSWDQPVTIAGMPGERAIFSGGASGFNLYNMRIAYLVVDNLIFDQGAAWQPLGPDLHHIRLQNSEVKNNPNSGLGGGYGAHHLEFVRLHVHHNGVDRLDHGMYICVKNLVIRDSDIHDNAGYGLQLFDSNNRGCGDDAQIYNNRIHHNRGDGGTTLNYASNLQFYNNLVYNNVGDGVSVSYGDPDNVQIYNNTIVNNGERALILGSNCRGCESRVTNGKVQNNILFGNKFDEVRTEGGTAGVRATNNLCSNMGTGCTLRGNPQFTSLSGFDFTLTPGSPAINAGELLPSVPMDMAGTPRAQGPAYDLGAYEVKEATTPPTPTPNAKPIYVAQTGGDDGRDCWMAEDERTPKRTLTSALGCMTVPGKKVRLKRGTYVEVVDTLLTPITGGTSYETATVIEAYTGERVILQIPLGQQIGVWLRNQDHHLILRDLVLDGANRAWSNGLVLYPGTHDVWLERLEVKNTLSGFEAIYLAGVTNVGLYGCTIHHAGTAGIGLSDVIEGLTIERCTLSNNPIDLWFRTGTQAVTMRDNQFQSKPVGATPVLNRGNARKARR